MKRNFTRFLAALALLACMTSSMVVMAMDDGYIVGTTALTSVSNGDLVVWGTSNSNLAKSCSSNWIYLSSVPSEWIVFTVETTDGGFYLKTPDNQYVYSSAAKKVEFSSTNQTVLTINSTNNYVNGGSSIGNYTYNSTGIRPYSGTNYTAAYLYAVTEIPSGTTYTVTYDANGGTGSMTDSNSPYNAGATVTVLDNEFTRTGYTFDHWNTAADDGGTDYDEGDEFTINANTTLYAQWTDNSGSSTVTATLTQSNLGLTGSYTTGTEKTIDGITYVYTDLMKNNDNIQAKASTGTIKNSTAYPGDITSVAITHYGTARATTINGSADGTNWTQVATGSGSLEADFSGLGYKYFQITRGSNAAYWTKIEITYSNDVTPTCATPTFNPAAGTYDQTQNVNIACATEGATIYYTLDGTDPTTGSNVYSDALSISETTTVKAMAVKADYNNSAVATATYTIVPPAVATPTFSPEAGVYTEAQSVTISCETNGATIQYKLTENGEWQDYTEALAINETTTVWAKATKEGMTDSEIATATYTIVLPLSTLQAIFDRATEVGNTATSVIIALQNWVVSGVSTNGKNVFVTDGTKGFVIFNNGADMGFAVGNILSGTVSCKVQLYNGFAELTQLNSSTEGISIATGGTVTVADIEMANLAGVNTGALVHYDNLTCSIENNKYYLSDGTTTLQVYNALYAFGSTFVAGHVYNITGIYQQYNTNSGDTKEILPRSADDIEEVVIAEPSITVDPALVEVDAAEHDGTLDLTYENLTITSMTDFAIQYYDAEGEETEEPDWIEVTVAEQDPQVGEGYVASYYMLENEGDARTAYFKVFALGDEDYVYSNLVTISQAAPVVPPTLSEWVMTSLNDLTENDVFVIVGVYDVDESSFAMSNNSTGAPSAVEVTMVGNTLSGDIDDNLKWNLSIGEDGYTFYPDGETETWLYCTNTNNGVRVGTDENNVFSMTSEGYLFNNATERYIGIYNGQDWRCYTSINNNIKDQTFAFYKRVDASEIKTYTLDITGYDDSDGGYYLIASPVSMIRPTSDNGFLTEVLEQYDLYYFDQAQQGYEWRNYKTKHFNIASGKGYLYASQENTTLTFTGVPYTGNGTVELSFDENNTWGAENYFWNLVGNPFGQTAYIDRDFYAMNEDGSEIMTDASTGAIEAMQGIFVIAEEDGETLTFSTEAPNQSANLTMNLSQNRGAVIDRAIVRFNEGRQLPKFQLNAGSTKLYIPQGSKDYAVVRSANEGEMPVSFKAAENGTYTLNVEAKNVEVTYLHLIDNRTGADVDLLANPSYTFEANKGDNASRFRLVFKAGTSIEENASTNSFAYFNGSAWVISNTGDATLQVIDMMGRVLSSEQISGNTAVNINETAGIYMLRLVNGENVMVQKVVVR